MTLDKHVMVITGVAGVAVLKSSIRREEWGPHMHESAGPSGNSLHRPIPSHMSQPFAFRSFTLSIVIRMSSYNPS